jgi:acetylornithine deacetylase/succinyl-diaminopimelate desuccinylase-like protein
VSGAKASGGATGRPSQAIDPETLERAHAELVEELRSLIRLRTVNPPGDEIIAARHLAALLEDAGIPSQVFEPFPGRGSVVARLRGDGTGGAPLLLLSHTDVVPAPPEGWTHDPFGGDLADGYVWGRGAVDMKGMVAMEVAVMRLLAAEARAAGRDPATDPVPGLTRDVIFASTADEEAGGVEGAGWLVDNRPDLLAAAGALNECGGVSLTLAGTRLYPIQVAERGFAIYDLAVKGRWSHGSMPGDGSSLGSPSEASALLRSGEIARRLAVPGAPRQTDSMRAFLSGAAAALPAEQARWLPRLADEDPRAAETALSALCTQAYRRATRAVLRTTFSPNVLHVGTRHNVIPGAADLTVDVRVLPGTTPDDVASELRSRIGDDLAPFVEPTLRLWGVPVEAPASGALWDVMTSALRAADPDGIPLPVMAPFATDAKHTVRLGIPTYGFSPLRLGADDSFLELFHGDDERVSVDALRFGLPVLYDVVRAFCG